MNGLEMIERTATNTTKDANHALTYSIPAGTGTAQLIIYGLDDSTNEYMTVENIRFSSTGTDTDSDGIPDSYEAANGLNSSDAADRDLDLDGDGQSNYQEYLAGTAANDRSSSLRVTAISVAAAGMTDITWSAVPGKRYRLQTSPDLAAWTDAGPLVTATGNFESLTTAAFSAPLAGKGYVRVRVVP
jgi:hypothetical protein